MRGKDITGQRFGRLVAIERTDEKHHSIYIWKCVCDCGNVKLTNTNYLSTGQVKSCGCLQQQGNPKDIAGKRFGRLVAIERLEMSPNAGFFWKCACDCGGVVKVTIGNLNSGHTSSCGCLQGENLTKHGMSNTPTYVSYRKMLSRTRHEEYKEFYGDVSVCDEWDTYKGGSFENFYRDMGERPEGCTLNRINGAKIYSKDTCEWASGSLQSYDQKMNKTNSSGRSGVRWREDRQMWEAKITVKKEIKILYYGDSFEAACKARELAELKYYGFTKE